MLFLLLAADIHVTSIDPPHDLAGEWTCSGQTLRVPEKVRTCDGELVTYSTRVVVAAHLRHELLGVSPGQPRGAYEVIVDGERVGGRGSFDPLLDAPRIGGAFLIPPSLDDDGVLDVSIRVKNDPSVLRAQPAAILPAGPLLLGRMPAVDTQAKLAVELEVKNDILASIALFGVFLFVALYHMLVWLLRRDLLGYLWFGIFALIASAWITLSALPGVVPLTYRHLEIIGNGALGSLANLAFIEFFWRFLTKARPPRRWRIYQGLFVVFAVVGFVPGVGLEIAVSMPVILAKIAMPPWALVEIIRMARKGVREAKVLLGAILVGVVGAPFEVWMRMSDTHWPVSPGQVTLALFMLSMAVALAAQFAKTLEDLVATNKAIERFVPHPFLKLLGRDTVRDVVKGDSIETQLAVMFCDLRGFTTLAEGLGPQATFKFINAYLAKMEPVIHRSGGFINEYMGDGIMALFPTGADAAVDAAIHMCRTLDDINHGRAAPLKIGIGVHTGTVMLGTIGGGEQLDAGVIGDVVNAASRLEGMTKQYGATALISGETMRALTTRQRVRILDAVRAKGKNEPLELVELVVDGERGSLDHALALYREGKFSEAARAFDALGPDDGPALALADRSRFLEKAPPPSWDGVYQLNTK